MKEKWDQDLGYKLQWIKTMGTNLIITNNLKTYMLKSITFYLLHKREM